MGETLNSLTVGELISIMAGIIAVYAFCKSIIIPLAHKWLKIDKNANDLTALKSLPDRVESLEGKVARDYERITAIDEVNVLMMEALRALIRNRRTGNDVDKLQAVEDKIDGFLVGKVRS